MNATYKIANAGNLAIQTEVWTIPVGLAKATLKTMDAAPGSYWSTNFAKPVRRAVRAKQATVRIYTAGFSTGDLANQIRAAGGSITYAGQI